MGHFAGEGGGDNVAVRSTCQSCMGPERGVVCDAGHNRSEQVLRERLQENVRERGAPAWQEDLGRKRDESLPQEQRPQRYQDMTGPTGEAGATEETPVYELADISIVSKRVQKLPRDWPFATPLARRFAVLHGDEGR
ncbi:MAG: hypothetical protein MRJ92_02805 [Nitrospira sp.]|nr:hypothetical protein [Nitrospira sp.]